jgi:hypothetical protein
MYLSKFRVKLIITQINVCFVLRHINYSDNFHLHTVSILTGCTSITCSISLVHVQIFPYISLGLSSHFFKSEE